MTTTITSFPNILIRASAGSGKTFQLTNRYLGLMHHAIPPEQILATTFTRKAAGEILGRVMSGLARAALDENERSQLAHHLRLSSLTRSDCLQSLERLVRNLHRLHISTLDAFFAQLAGSFSLELGLPPGWRIVEPVRDGNLRREAIATTLQGNSKRELERLLQLMAKGEARRSVGALVQGAVDDLYGLYLETDPAAWRRIPKPKMLSDEAVEAAVETLRDAPVPNDSRAHAAREADAVAAQQHDWALFINGGLAKKVLDGATTYYRKDLPPDLLSAYRVLLDHARSALLNQVANQTEATYQLLDKFHHAYVQLKHEARAVRFDDITRSLARGMSGAAIQQHEFRLDASINHLLLDEFQDTSLAQWHVLRAFARHVTMPRDNTNPNDNASTTAGASPSSFFCVGDVKQAIYGWRGGLSEIFEALQHELPELTDQSMNKSYRSSPPVIDTVNQAFSGMTRHPNLGSLEAGVARWCEGFGTHTTNREELQGYVELCTAPSTDKDQTKKEAKSQYAAEYMRELVEQAPGYGFGVLVRSNDMVARMIYELRRQGVPASEEGGNPLTDSPAVQVLLSLLKLADHPGDTISRFHVATSPLGALLHYCDHRRRDRALALAREVRSELLHEGYGRTILRWARLLDPYCDHRDRSRLQQFVTLAHGYEPIASLRTRDFLAHVAKERIADPTTAEVRVMTVHQAKGLQFDVVVLPDLDYQLAGQPPSCVVGQPSPTEPVDRVCLYRNAEIQKLLPPELRELFETHARRSADEAMCVLYVALTRAIHALHMIIDPSGKSERRLHKTPAGLLRGALTDGSPVGPRERPYRCGNPRWFDHERPRDTSQPRGAVASEHINVKLAAMPRDPRLEHTAPSKLEGGARVSARRVLNLDSAVATARGTLIHAFFEEITWLDEGAPQRQRLEQLAKPLNTTGVDVTQQLDAFERMIAMPRIAAVLHRDFYQSPRDPSLLRILGPERSGMSLRPEVHNERRFAVRDNGRMLSGAIDRLVLLHHDDRLVAADVLDYKTDYIDATNPHALIELVAHYHPQLEAYRRAVSAMFRLPLENISARLLFVSAGIAHGLDTAEERP
ncbi:MAG: UvrD-helicase domain-containing protein [Pirellulaceae bacterium]